MPTSQARHLLNVPGLGMLLAMDICGSAALHEKCQKLHLSLASAHTLQA